MYASENHQADQAERANGALDWILACLESTAHVLGQIVPRIALFPVAEKLAFS